MNMTKLADRLADEHELTRVDARRLLDTVFTTIVGVTKQGEDVFLTGFGRFRVTSRAARRGYNPRTGAPMRIPGSRRLAFSPARAVREALNGPMLRRPHRLETEPTNRQAVRRRMDHR